MATLNFGFTELRKDEPAFRNGSLAAFVRNTPCALVLLSGTPLPAVVSSVYSTSS